MKLEKKIKEFKRLSYKFDATQRVFFEELVDILEKIAKEIEEIKNDSRWPIKRTLP